MLEHVGRIVMQIYISYRQKQPAKSIVQNWLCPSLKQADIEYRIDEVDCGFGHNIEQFEREIGEADIVLIMLSKQYFYSINCMFELALVIKNRRHRMPPILVSLDDFNRTHDQYNSIYAYWENQLEQIRQNMRGDRNRDLPFISDLEKVQLILGNFGDAWKLICDLNTLTFEQISKNQFRKLIAHIKKEVLIDDDTMNEIQTGIPIIQNEHTHPVNIVQNGQK